MIKLCTHQAFNIYYFKYTVKGINIVFLSNHFLLNIIIKKKKI